MRLDLETERAEHPERNRFYVGAVALDPKGKILSLKINDHKKSHPRMKDLSFRSGVNDHKIFLHAEVAAILAAPRYSIIDTLIVGRILDDGSFSIAKPCPMCQLAISESQIRRVYYTDHEGQLILLKERN